MPLNTTSPDSYTTRDRLVVLSLAAVQGAKDWDGIARVLNSSFQPSSRGGARKYTHGDCKNIYQDALNGVSDSGCAGDESGMLYESLYNLKGRRLDEIQERLEHIALVIEEMGAQVDSTDSLLESSTTDDDIHLAMAQPRTSESLNTTSREAEASRQTVEIGRSGLESESAARAYSALNSDHTTESGGKLPEVGRDTLIGDEAECATETDMTTRHNGRTSEPADEGHDHTDAGVHLTVSVTSKPHSPTAASVSSSDNGDSVSNEPDEMMAPALSSPSRPVDELGLQDGISDSEIETGSVHMDGEAQHDQPTADSQDAKAAASSLDEHQIRNWKKNINTVWRDISGHRLGSMFNGPIKSADAPNYYDVIRHPLDLKTIKNRIRDDEIATTIEFYRDVMHMLMNALMYNAEDTEVYQMTMEIIPDAQACIEQLLQTEAAVNQPKAGGNHITTDDDDTTAALAFVAAAAAANAASGGDDGRTDGTHHHHEADDSDSSVPTKRRRRVASERVSKHLRS